MSAMDDEDAVEVAEPERRKPRWPSIVAGVTVAVLAAWGVGEGMGFA